MSSKNEFRLIKQCQKLCIAINTMQGTADKSYRYTICQDLRKKSEDVIHLVRKANFLKVGTDERIEKQNEALETLEQIQDLIGVVSKLLNSGTKREAQIEKELEDVKRALLNWIESDNKVRKSICREEIRRLSWILFRYKEISNFFVKYLKDNPPKIDERMQIACDELEARFRIAKKDYEKAVIKYDNSIRSLRALQGNKDDSVLAQVISGFKESGLLKYSDETLQATVDEKRVFIKEINKEVIENSLFTDFHTKSFTNETLAKLAE